jgi:hypothetical protein
MLLSTVRDDVCPIRSECLRAVVVQDGNGKENPVCHTLSENASKISARTAADANAFANLEF